MTIKLHHGALKYFERKARTNPNEIYAALYGKIVSPSIIDVEKFVYPKLKVSTRDYVITDDEYFKPLHEKQLKLGRQYIGSLHSHPEVPPVLSPADFKGFIQEDPVCGRDILIGVCEVRNGKAWTVFWEHSNPLPVEIKFFRKANAA